MTSPRRLAVPTAALAVLAAILCLPASPAHAALPTTIAKGGVGAGKVQNPEGVAVDQSTGDLYVADRNNFRVVKFDSEGEFLLAWGWGVADGKSQELQVCGPAAAPPTKRCFNGSNVVVGPGAVAPEAVAVEQSSGAVYVGDALNSRVSKFTPSGALLYMLGRNVNKTKAKEEGPGAPYTQAEKNICTAADLEAGDVCGAGLSGPGPGEFTEPRALAFDSEGKLWVGDKGRVQRFDSDGAFLSEVPLPPGTRNSALAIDPASDDFYMLGPAGRNEVYSVDLHNNPSSSEFTFSFEGQTTAPIPGNASGETIQAALEALPAIGPGNVGVLMSASGRFAEVAFIHDLGGRDLPPMSASGGTPPVTVSQGGQGAPGSVLRLDSTGALLETLDDAPGDLPLALGIDAAGDLYVGDAGFPYHLLKFDSAGGLISVFGAGQVSGNIFGNGGPRGNALAFDEATAALYVSNPQENTVKRYSAPEPGPLPADQRVEELEPTSATLAATLNPEGDETTYRFEYDTAPYEGEAEHGTQVPVPDATLAASFEEVAVEAALEGLIPDTTYHFRLVATNHCNDAEPAEECTVAGPDTAFATRTAIGIEAQWASDLAAHDATLNARLDPLGVEAEWWLEYGASPCAEGGCAKAPEGTLPAGFGEIPVAVALRGLEASTTYHYRFAASDVRDGTPYTTYGDDRSFTTQPAGLGFALADSRAWEMVSPPEKHGGRIAAPNGKEGGQAQAAANGEALAYLSNGSLEAYPEGSRLIEQSSQLSRRGAGGSWSTVDLTPPHTEVNPLVLGQGLEYKLFDTNLGRALLQPRDATPLSPDTTERTPYVRENGDPPAYTPLVTAAEVPPGTEFGKLGPKAQAPEITNGNVRVQGASPDLRHVVLGSIVPLAAGAAPGSLYEWSTGGLEPLSVKPGEENAVQAELGSGAGSTVGAVSADGSRVFWTSGGLYLRDTTRDETLRLDEEEEGAFGTGAVAPRFQGASADGSVAFFTDPQNLTEDANEEGADLYRWQDDGNGGCEEAGGCLTDLTAQVANFGESAEVLGLLSGVAEDGSRAYFVARGVLDESPNAEGESATPGQPNLYAWHEGEGVRFVAGLSGEDSTDWGQHAGGAFSLTAAASPSGRYLALMSASPLTGYDNRDASSGEPAQEVFRYDAAAEELICVSCNPSGARPQALVVPNSLSFLQLDPQFLWTGRLVAAVVPEASTLSNQGPSIYRPRYVHDDGRVFFNAVDSLVAADSNGTGDVYEYEPAGAGTCTATAGDAGTAVAPGGCVSLISSGHAEEPAAFIDASEGGSDVFFYTTARLSVTDVDGEVDVYDARVGGEPARLEPLAECLGEACQPPASPPESQTPASAAFRGPGNLRQAAPERRGCPKGNRKVRRHGKARCVKKHAHRGKHRRGHPHNRRAH